MPLEPQEACQFLRERLDVDLGRFVYPAGNLALGVGQIYRGIRFPLWDDEADRYRAARGIVYVLTHECDVDAQNVRAFNTHVLVCSVIRFEEWLVEYAEENTEEHVLAFLGNLASGNVSRVVYLPYLEPNHLPFGGLLYLNAITNTAADVFVGATAERLVTATSYGMAVIDRALHNHLFRAKAERLPLDPEGMHISGGE